MNVIDGSVVAERGVVMVSSKGRKESEIGDRACCIHLASQCNGFARVHAFQLRNGFTVFFECIGQAVKPPDTFLHRGGRPPVSGPEGGCRGGLYVAGV